MHLDLLVPALALIPTQDAPAAKKQLTLDQTTGSDAVSFSAKAPRWRWDDDGVLLVSGSGKDRRWIDALSGDEVDAPGKAEPADEAEEEEADSDDDRKKPDKKVVRAALEKLEGVDDKQARRITNATSDFSEDGTIAVYQYEDALYGFADGRAAALLTGVTEDMEFVDLAPDGSAVAFVMENDLYVVAVPGGHMVRVTDDGSPEMFNGKLDWVYQEEIYGRGRFKAFQWSPDSAHIAFLSLDESPVHEFTVIDHIEDDHHRVVPEITNYPKAGDPNPIVALGIARIEADAAPVVRADLSPMAEAEPLVVRFDWTPSGDGLLFCVQDRLQTWAQLNRADPATGAFETWIREESDAWVNRPASPRWLEDGTFLWESERTGYNHLYRYSATGELLGAVTSGEWAVRRILELDEDAGLVWFTGTEGGAVNTNVYRCGLDGSGLARLTQGDGSHSITFNGDRSLFLNRFSSLSSPGGVRLCTGDGEVLRVLGESEVAAADEYATSTWELVEIPARDGFVLDGALLKPVDFDPERVYPVWLPTYSGPNAPSVRNRWNSSSWYQYLAQQGVIVLQVNVRTASGRGRWATSLGYKRFGVLELQDLEDAVAWLTQNPWADAERVGITGYSYGGFISAYALCKSDKFALGIAGGGVYEWSMYDTVYTERYMSTPQLNPEGYAETSVVQAVEGLDGHLLLHHGTMDDNVHMQNLMHLIYALQKAGKSFEVMPYPQTRHGVRDSEQRAHLRQLEWRTIREQLVDTARNPG